MSGTSQRVGAHFAANTIGIQMAATGLGTALIPSLVGVLARRVSLEVIPVSLGIVLLGLLGLYLLSTKNNVDLLELRITHHENSIFGRRLGISPGRHG